MAQDVALVDGKKIGLIGGLALRAGIFYYEQIARRYAAQDRRLELVLAHADIGHVLPSIAAGDRAGLGLYLGTLANELFDSGSKLVAITAVAPHFAIDDVKRVARGPVVSVLGVIPAGLEKAGVDRIAIFGNRAVMESRVFGTVPEHGVVTLSPSAVDEVHRTYSDIALQGKCGTDLETQLLERVARDAIDRGGAEAILLAGTDLSSFYAEREPAFPHVDVAQLHIDQIVAAAQV